MHQIRQNARRSTSDAIVWRARSLIAPLDRRSRSCTAPLVGAARRDLGSLSLIWALSLSLSLSLRKWFEVKMRGENDFQVKGENIGQPEVIFRKMIFSMTAKHSGFIKNDFRKQFSPNSNTHLVNADNQLHLSKEKPHQLQGVHCWSHTIFTWCFVQWRWTQYPWLKLKLKWGKLGWLTSHGQCQGQHSTVHAAVLNFCSPYTVLQTCGKC